MSPFVAAAVFALLLIDHAVSKPQSLFGDSTGVTGFGSKSRKKTIFRLYEEINSTALQESRMTLQKNWPTADSGRKGKSLESDPKSKTKNKRKSDDAITSDPKMWVCLSNDPDTLYLRTARNANQVEAEYTPSIIQISVAPDTGIWDATLVDTNELLPSSSWAPIEGIFGLYPVPSGFLWVLITKSEPVFDAPELDGKRSWWKIRRVTNMEIIHLGRPGAFLSEEQIKEEVRQIKLMRNSLKHHAFYFVLPSKGGILDMTKNMQRSLADGRKVKNKMPLTSSFQRWSDDSGLPDPRFFWNEASVRPLLDRQKSAGANFDPIDCVVNKIILDHTIPLTSAFVGVQHNITAGNHSSFSYSQILISRRSKFRTGTRFTKRGADSSGAVANYAETEQISLIVSKKTGLLQKVLSHVQIRGSIPLRWSSPTDIKTYRPRIRIGTDALAQARALRLHLVEQARIYTSNKPHVDPAKIIFVNLIDKHGDQGRLGRTFDAVLSAVLDVHNTTSMTNSQTAQSKTIANSNILMDAIPVKHIWFDFHAEVKNGKWNKLSSLLESQNWALNEHGHFSAIAPKADDAHWSIERIQDGVIRTNCMDCLDRTNVVQSIFGRAILFDLLSTLAKSKKEKKEWKDFKESFLKNPLSLPWAQGEASHRALWADNADAISRLYAGTPALKGDFTRTGRRTKRGALDDGMNSLQRYYLNNFLDADRQEGMDLMVGYAPFSNVDHDDVEEELMETIKGKYLDISSVRETVRQSLWQSVYETATVSADKNDADETQAELKVSQNRRPLDLRWLPGDLQHHLRDLATRRSDKSKVISALEDIDRRSASDQPWWSMHQPGDESDLDSSSDEDEDEEYKEMRARIAARESLADDIHHSTIPPGYLVAMMIVGMKAPVALAASIVGLFWLLSLPSFVFDD